jgi:5-methylcytosine-specific restriction endonuclease McrA
MSRGIRFLSDSSVSRRRELRRSTAWFTEARILKKIARRTQKCVECRVELPSHRQAYCSRRCRWRFHGHYFWDAARTYVLHRDRFRCRQCKGRFRVRQLEVDHIVEIGRGGAPLDYDNLQTLCRACHREKTRRFLRSLGSTLRRPADSQEPFPSPLEGTMPWFPA